jgi:glycosyltransferase involved in cell wall biosynthesis
MKIIFVSSGNSGQISPIVLSQGESLEKKGVEVSYFLIKGKGIKGYLSNVGRLRQFLKSTPHDFVHAHYSWSAIVATLAGSKKLVVSLMGSDVKSSRIQKRIILFFSRFFWKKTIVKSTDMKDNLGLSDAVVIPNGVNFQQFYPKDKLEAQANLQWDSQKINLLFAGNPNRHVKNFPLVKQSLKAIGNTNIVLHTLEDVPFKQMNDYYNAADGVLLSSLWEGSPNVIKEAMACNKPILSTNVGDVKYNFGNEEGFFIASHQPSEYQARILDLLKYQKQEQLQLQECILFMVLRFRYLDQML